MTKALPGSTRYKRPDVPGGRPHRVRVQLTDAEHQALQQESRQRQVGIAQILIEGYFQPQKADPRVLMREVAGVRRIVQDERDFLTKLTQECRPDSGLWQQIADGLEWRDDMLVERYKW